jgi:hypothetical protein
VKVVIPTQVKLRRILFTMGFNGLSKRDLAKFVSLAPGADMIEIPFGKALRVLELL